MNILLILFWLFIGLSLIYLGFIIMRFFDDIHEMSKDIKVIKRIMKKDVVVEY